MSTIHESAIEIVPRDNPSSMYDNGDNGDAAQLPSLGRSKQTRNKPNHIPRVIEQLTQCARWSHQTTSIGREMYASPGLS